MALFMITLVMYMVHMTVVVKEGTYLVSVFFFVHLVKRLPFNAYFVSRLSVRSRPM